MFVLAQLQLGVASPAGLLKYKILCYDTNKFKSEKAKREKWLIGPTSPLLIGT